MGYPEKTERNAAMLADYNAGAWVPDIAAKYGIYHTGCYRILRRLGAFDDPASVVGRVKLRNQIIGQSERVRRRKSETMLARWRSGAMTGKPFIFGDDPERRKNYLALRSAMGAAYARQAMGV